MTTWVVETYPADGMSIPPERAEFSDKASARQEVWARLGHRGACGRWRIPASREDGHRGGWGYHESRRYGCGGVSIVEEVPTDWRPVSVEDRLACHGFDYRGEF